MCDAYGSTSLTQLPRPSVAVSAGWECVRHAIVRVRARGSVGDLLPRRSLGLTSGPCAGLIWVFGERPRIMTHFLVGRTCAYETVSPNCTACGGAFK